MVHVESLSIYLHLTQIQYALGAHICHWYQLRAIRIEFAGQLLMGKTPKALASGNLRRRLH
ncbi:MAG: hypothetical protein V7K73_00450, partial [Nostoc sp.]